MHYQDLTTTAHGGDISGAQLLLGEVAAVGPETITLKSATGSLHGFAVSAGFDRFEVGWYAILCDVGERWELLGSYGECGGARAALPGAMTRAHERRRHQAELAAGEPAATRVEEKLAAATDIDPDGLARAQAEIATALTEPAPAVEQPTAKPASKKSGKA